MWADWELHTRGQGDKAKVASNEVAMGYLQSLRFLQILRYLQRLSLKTYQEMCVVEISAILDRRDYGKCSVRDKNSHHLRVVGLVKQVMLSRSTICYGHDVWHDTELHWSD